MANPWQVSKALTAGDTNIIAESQSPGAGAIVLNGAAVSGGVATLDTQRRILLTSGGNDSGITFTVTGTNEAGNAISETLGGGNVGAVYTDLDFYTVSSITHTGSVAGTLIVGTNSIGSTTWFCLDRYLSPMNFGICGVISSGSVNYTVEYTYDDPNAPFTGTIPTTFSLAGMTAIDTSSDGSVDNPINAIRFTINSGTGTLKGIVIAAGWGSP